MRIQKMDDILNDTLEKLGYPYGSEKMETVKIIYKTKNGKFSSYRFKNKNHLLLDMTENTPFSFLMKWINENDNNVYVEFLGSEQRIITNISVKLFDFLYCLKTSVNFKTLDNYNKTVTKS